MHSGSCTHPLLLLVLLLQMAAVPIEPRLLVPAWGAPETFAPLPDPHVVPTAKWKPASLLRLQLTIRFQSELLIRTDLCAFIRSFVASKPQWGTMDNSRWFISGKALPGPSLMFAWAAQRWPCVEFSAGHGAHVAVNDAVRLLYNVLIRTGAGRCATPLDEQVNEDGETIFSLAFQQTMPADSGRHMCFSPDLFDMPRRWLRPTSDTTSRMWGSLLRQVCAFATRQDPVLSNARSLLNSLVDRADVATLNSRGGGALHYNGRSPLMIAASCADVEAVASLLRRESDLALDDVSDELVPRTPLELCRESTPIGSAETAETLILQCCSFLTLALDGRRAHTMTALTALRCGEVAVPVPVPVPKVKSPPAAPAPVMPLDPVQPATGTDTTAASAAAAVVRRVVPKHASTLGIGRTRTRRVGMKRKKTLRVDAVVVEGSAETAPVKKRDVLTIGSGEDTESDTDRRPTQRRAIATLTRKFMYTFPTILATIVCDYMWCEPTRRGTNSSGANASSSSSSSSSSSRSR